MFICQYFKLVALAKHAKVFVFLLTLVCDLYVGYKGCLKQFVLVWYLFAPNSSITHSESN